MSIGLVGPGAAWTGLAPWLGSLGGSLLHSVWQIGLLGAIYWMVERSPLPARVKHDLGLLALVVAVAWPAAALLEFEGPAGPTLLTDSGAVATSEPSTLSATPGAIDPSSTGNGWLRSEAVRAGLGLLWVFGAAWMLARLTVGWLELRRLRRSTSAPGLTARIRDRFHLNGRALGLTKSAIRRVAIRVPETATRFGVCTFGFLRPVLVVPMATLSGLSPQHLDAVLLHEIAHLHRRDGLWSALQSVLDCLLFFHPVARWISSRVRQQREVACDDLAVATGLEPSLYAGALLSLARHQSRVLTPAPAATGGHMKSRIRRILEPRSVHAGLHPSAILSIALLLLLPVALVARSNSGQVTIEEPGKPVELVLRGEVMTFAPDALQGLRSAEFATSASAISGALLDRDRERHFRPHVQEILSRPTLKMLEGGPGSIWTALIDPDHRDRFRTDDGRVTNGILKLELTPHAVTTSSALLDLSLAIEPSEDVVETTDPADVIRLALEDVIVTEDKPLLLYETADADTGALRGILIELVMTSKERPKLERPLTFAVEFADYNEVLNTILRYVELDRDDSAVDLDRFEVPITLQAQQVPAGEMLEIVLRMNCLRAELDDTTARIFEMQDCEPSRSLQRIGER